MLKRALHKLSKPKHFIRIIILPFLLVVIIATVIIAITLHQPKKTTPSEEEETKKDIFSMGKSEQDLLTYLKKRESSLDVYKFDNLVDYSFVVKDDSFNRPLIQLEDSLHKALRAVPPADKMGLHEKAEMIDSFLRISNEFRTLIDALCFLLPRIKLSDDSMRAPLSVAFEKNANYFLTSNFILGKYLLFKNIISESVKDLIVENYKNSKVVNSNVDKVLDTKEKVQLFYDNIFKETETTITLKYLTNWDTKDKITIEFESKEVRDVKILKDIIRYYSWCVLISLIENIFEDFTENSVTITKAFKIRNVEKIKILFHERKSLEKEREFIEELIGLEIKDSVGYRKDYTNDIYKTLLTISVKNQT
eukprot:GAHX01001870.1.p1 GENE.GAHX01001870.1~~GAHX01001870.1.p1  ORF type:complete len:364 (-),score=69.18 GAHX01001870.1:63-1154(-)